MVHNTYLSSKPILNSGLDAVSSKQKNKHCVKNARIQSFSGLHFPSFGLNTESYS